MQGAHSPVTKFKERYGGSMKIRPLGDRVVLQKKKAEDKTKSGIILPDGAKEKPQEAVVIAVGKGECADSAAVTSQIKEGDMVIYSQYAGTNIKLDDEEYIIVSGKDIIAVVE